MHTCFALCILNPNGFFNSSDCIEVIAKTIKQWIVYNYTIFWLIVDVSRKRLHSGNNYNSTNRSEYISFT